MHAQSQLRLSVIILFHYHGTHYSSVAEGLTGQSVPVHHSDCEGAVKGEGGRDLKHLTKDWVQVPRDVVVPPTYLVLASIDLDVRVRLHVEGERKEAAQGS